MVENLTRKIELIHRSAVRLMGVVALMSEDSMWWRFLRREAWLHFKRSLELLWLVQSRQRGWYHTGIAIRLAICRLKIALRRSRKS